MTGHQVASTSAAGIDSYESGSTNFYDLPRELRDKVYREVLLVPYSIDLVPKYGSICDEDRPPQVTSLIKASPLFRTEAFQSDLFGDFAGALRGWLKEPDCPARHLRRLEYHQLKEQQDAWGLNYWSHLYTFDLANGVKVTYCRKRFQHTQWFCACKLEASLKKRVAKAGGDNGVMLLKFAIKKLRVYTAAVESQKHCMDCGKRRVGRETQDGHVALWS